MENRKGGGGIRWRTKRAGNFTVDRSGFCLLVRFFSGFPIVGPKASPRKFQMGARKTDAIQPFPIKEIAAETTFGQWTALGGGGTRHRRLDYSAKIDEISQSSAPPSSSPSAWRLLRLVHNEILGNSLAAFHFKMDGAILNRSVLFTWPKYSNISIEIVLSTCNIMPIKLNKQF